MLKIKENLILKRLKNNMTLYLINRVNKIYRDSLLTFHYLKIKLNKFKNVNKKDMDLNRIGKIY